VESSGLGYWGERRQHRRAPLLEAGLPPSLATENRRIPIFRRYRPTISPAGRFCQNLGVSSNKIAANPAQTDEHSPGRSKRPPEFEGGFGHVSLFFAELVQGPILPDIRRFP
jgi:hypothetical protein